MWRESFISHPNQLFFLSCLYNDDTFQASAYGTDLVFKSQVKKNSFQIYAEGRGKYHLYFMIEKFKLCSVRQC